MPGFHKCDERCVCPEDGLPLFYAPAIDDHACQDVECRYGHGLNEVLLQEWVAQILEPRVPDEIDLAWGRRGWGGNLGREIETVKVNPALL